MERVNGISIAMSTWTDLADKTLVEVSSGRGGGLDYISRYLNPKKAIGVDLSPVQIDYCQKIYGKNEKLEFVNVKPSGLILDTEIT